MNELELQENLVAAHQAYNKAHADWFNTPVFDPSFPAKKAELARKRAEYVAAYKAKNPDSIVF